MLEGKNFNHPSTSIKHSFACTVYHTHVSQPARCVRERRKKTVTCMPATFSCHDGAHESKIVRFPPHPLSPKKKRKRENKFSSLMRKKAPRPSIAISIDSCWQRLPVVGWKVQKIVSHRRVPELAGKAVCARQRKAPLCAEMEMSCETFMFFTRSRSNQFTSDIRNG
jgi:hypothetical protein